MMVDILMILYVIACGVVLARFIGTVASRFFTQSDKTLWKSMPYGQLVLVIIMLVILGVWLYFK